MLREYGRVNGSVNQCVKVKVKILTYFTGEIIRKVI